MLISSLPCVRFDFTVLLFVTDSSEYSRSIQIRLQAELDTIETDGDYRPTAGNLVFDERWAIRLKRCCYRRVGGNGEPTRASRDCPLPRCRRESQSPWRTGGTRRVSRKSGEPRQTSNRSQEMASECGMVSDQPTPPPRYEQRRPWIQRKRCNPAGSETIPDKETLLMRVIRCETRIEKELPGKIRYKAAGCG